MEDLKALDKTKLEHSGIISTNDISVIENLLEIDPSIVLVKIRKITENIIKNLYIYIICNSDLDSNLDNLPTLAEMISKLKGKNIFPPMRNIFFHTLRLTGNVGAHSDLDDIDDAKAILPMFNRVINWYIEKEIPPVLKNIELRQKNLAEQQLNALPHDDQKIESETIVLSYQFKYCQNCGNEITDKDQKYCEICGVSLFDLQLFSKEDNETSKFFCKNCGTPYIPKPEIRFCKDCGTFFDFKKIDLRDRKSIEHKIELKSQDWMPPIISNFIGKELFNEDLLNEQETEYHGLKITKEGFCSKKKENELFSLFTFLTTSQINPLIKCEERKKNIESWDNPLETHVILKMISHIHDEIKKNGLNNLWANTDQEAKSYWEKKGFSEKNPLKIGVISFYNLHFQKIRTGLTSLPFIEILNQKNQNNLKFKDISVLIKIGTVNLFTDRDPEKMDIAIVPLTRTNTTRSIGILEYRDIVYSALSIAKHNLFVIGDWDFYKDLKIDKRKSKENNPFIKLCEYCKKNKLVTYIPGLDKKIGDQILKYKKEEYPTSEVRELSRIKYQKYKKSVRKRS